MTKTLALISLSFMCLAAWAQSEPVSSGSREICIRNVNVISMVSDEIRYRQDVTIKDGLIVSIAPSARKTPRDAFLIDGTGQFLMPGLAEMHAHVPPGVQSFSLVEETLLLYLAHGVTTIRGMLGHPNHLKIRRMIDKDSLLGPRFYTSGPSLNGMSVKSPEAGAEMVRKQKEAGYDLLKLHPGLTNEKYDAIAKTAKELNIPMAGHVSFGVGVWKSIETGYSTIDHLDGFVEGLVPGIKDMPEQQAGPFGINVADQADPSRISELVESLKKHNVWVVPTESLIDRLFAPDELPENMVKEQGMKYVPPKTLQKWVTDKTNMMKDSSFNAAAVTRFIELRRKLIERCYRGGVGMLLGSDAPQTFNVTGFAIHNELKSMVKAGLTPFEALTMGTTNPAKYLGMSSKFGTLVIGASADLILLPANPLSDITNTFQNNGVMVRGTWLSREYLDKRLSTLAAAIQLR